MSKHLFMCLTCGISKPEACALMVARGFQVPPRACEEQWLERGFSYTDQEWNIKNRHRRPRCMLHQSGCSVNPYYHYDSHGNIARKNWVKENTKNLSLNIK